MSASATSTTLIPISQDVSIIGVYSRGEANQERIVVRVERSTDLGRYGLLLGLRSSMEGGVLPFRDHFFWFGNGVVQPGQFVIVYTGSGEDRSLPISNEPNAPIAYVLHWHKGQTIFANSHVVPLLIEIGAVNFGVPLLDQVQKES